MAKLSIEDIKLSDGEPSESPDNWARREHTALELRRIEAELDSLKTDTQAKKTYANRIFYLAAAWLGAVFIVILFQGFNWWSWKLSDSVVISLVAGATTGVIGLMAAVLAYNFRMPKPSK